jgi:propionate catabolism operon transcriptional regulator
MPVSLQGRLLRVLQEREVLRVGATEPTPVNVRVIAATHRDLKAHVDAGQFRLDLFYRLNILRIDVPPLRDRLADIPALAQALQDKVSARLGVDAACAQALMDALVAQAPHYSWPGNVRELENLIERLLAYAGPLADSGLMDADQAQAFVRATAPELFASDAADVPQRPAVVVSQPLKKRQTQVAQDEIARVLAQCGGDRVLASQRLGISRTTLWRKLKG